MPDSVLGLGATIDGYACEGGYDVAGGPATSYCALQSLGRCSPSRASDRVFRGLDAVVDALAGLGITELRLTTEWARLEPRPGLRDAGALAAYRRAIDAATGHGMHVDVLLCDEVLPSWAGHEPWLSSWAPERFAAHAGEVAAALSDAVRAVITFRRPHDVVRRGWLTGERPPFRRRALADAASALDGLLLAHRLAVEAIAASAPSVRCALLVGAAQLGDPWAGFGPTQDRAREFPRSWPGRASSPPTEVRVAASDPDELERVLEDPRLVGPVEVGVEALGSAHPADRLGELSRAAVARGHSLQLYGALASEGPLDGPRGLLEVDESSDALRVSVAPGVASVLASLAAG